MDQNAQDIQPTTVRCVSCGYDLTGAAIGGKCAECGTPVETSLRPLRGEQNCGTATTCMVLGILSLVACMILGPFAIMTYYSAEKQMSAGGYSKGSHSMAKAGLVMGIISTSLIVLYVLIFGVAALIH